MVNKPYSNLHSWGSELTKRFKYNYQQNTLSYQPIDEDLIWYEIPEDQQFIRFNSQGFILEPFNHWISFTVYENKIKVFYKYSREASDFQTPEKATYYRKHLPKQPEIIFTFSFQDQVKKVDGRWIKHSLMSV